MRTFLLTLPMIIVVTFLLAASLVSHGYSGLTVDVDAGGDPPLQERTVMALP